VSAGSLEDSVEAAKAIEALAGLVAQYKAETGVDANTWCAW
jgi:hypothetical protein